MRFPANTASSKVNNEDTVSIYEACSKMTVKIMTVVDVLVSLILTLNRFFTRP